MLVSQFFFNVKSREKILFLLLSILYTYILLCTASILDVILPNYLYNISITLFVIVLVLFFCLFIYYFVTKLNNTLNTFFVIHFVIFLKTILSGFWIIDGYTYCTTVIYIIVFLPIIYKIVYFNLDILFFSSELLFIEQKNNNGNKYGQNFNNNNNNYSWVDSVYVVFALFLVLLMKIFGYKKNVYTTKFVDSVLKFLKGWKTFNEDLLFGINGQNENTLVATILLCSYVLLSTTIMLFYFKCSVYIIHLLCFLYYYSFISFPFRFLFPFNLALLNYDAVSAHIDVLIKNPSLVFTKMDTTFDLLKCGMEILLGTRKLPPGSVKVGAAIAVGGVGSVGFYTVGKAYEAKVNADANVEVAKINAEVAKINADASVKVAHANVELAKIKAQAKVEAANIQDRNNSLKVMEEARKEAIEEFKRQQLDQLKKDNQNNRRTGWWS